jgi:nucleotide-binding universal stress UspA family protein
MNEISRILCPIDFSDFSRRALQYAVALARWYASTVTLVHVSPIVPLAAYAPGSGVVPSANLTDEDRDRLVASMRQLAVDAGSGVAFDYRLAEGHPAAQILNAVDVLSSDFIVMGTHGRSGFERMILGSVTEKVVRKARCPVLTVPGPEGDAAPAPAALFKRIVCAVDFSDCSIRGLNYALSLAQQADAELIVVHVIEMPSDASDVPAIVGGKALEQYVTEATQERRQRLERLIPDAAREACSIQTVIATGKPYREILRLAAEQTSDLIAIGLHGRGPVDLLFFGSTAQQVIRAAGCPVLTLRS